MLRPCPRTSPAAGSSKPHRMRSRLVLPVPLGPATRSSDPAATANSSPANRARSPRSQLRLTASSMGRRYKRWRGCAIVGKMAATEISPLSPAFGTPLSPAALKVMLLGAGELGKEVIIALQRLGVEVVAVDRYANAPAHQVAHRHYVIDMTDPA